MYHFTHVWFVEYHVWEKKYKYEQSSVTGKHRSLNSIFVSYQSTHRATCVFKIHSYVFKYDFVFKRSLRIF